MDSPTSTDNIQHPTLDPQLTSIELSDYPPTLTKHAILSLFSSFRIADIELHTGTARSFSAPLRVKIEVAGGNREAERAVRELDGRVIEGRRICVKMVETVPYERKEGVMDGIADELKVRIVNTARVYHPHYSTLLLFVREWMTATVYYAFLQGREPLTNESPPEVQADADQNLAQWHFLAAGTASTNDPKGRLDALQDLQEVIEKQGEARLAWEKWEGSELLNYEY